MNKDKEWYKAWYKAWTPGSTEYSRADSMVGIGYKCKDSKVSFSDLISWIGVPDLAYGTIEEGYIIYFYSAPSKNAANFDVVNGVVCDFGGVARFEANALRKNEITGEEEAFNFLDEMEPFSGSQMELSAGLKR